MDAFRIECRDFPQVPADVWRLRYRHYIAIQNKPYTHADHDRQELIEAVDRISQHWLAFDVGDNLVAAVRFTESNRGGFWHLFAKAVETIEASELSNSLIASRLVSNGTMASRRAIHELFVRSFETNKKDGIHFCFAQTSPSLQSLFRRFGFRTLSDPFADPYAGPQVIMRLDMRGSDFYRHARDPFRPPSRPILETAT